MSNQDQLAKDLEQKAQVGDKPKKFNFNFGGASSFTPNQFTPQYGQYGQYGAGQYGQYGQQPQQYGYNNYQNYAQPQAEPQGDSGMTLEEFQNKKKADLNTRTAAPKKVINVNKGGSSTIKISTSSGVKIAKPQKKEESNAEPKAETPATKEDTKADSKIATPEPKAEAQQATPEPKTETKQAASEDKAPSKVAPKKTASDEKSAEEQKVDSDAVLKEQEKLDKEIVDDMFGGEDVKEHLSVIFMGHVDAGKSTMGGNIMYLTGSVDKRTVEKYEKEAIDAGRQGWYLSWIMDTNSEERNEGKTIEVGRSTFETDKRRYTILDAPGHKMYVSHMIGGASQADCGILVISARKGEYETGFEKGGQTREHAILAKTQGVDKLLVVVNKMDDPTVNWSQERYDECIKKLGVFLKGTGFTDVSYMPVSGFTGAGLKDRVDPKVCPWYKGPSLLEFLDSIPIEKRKLSAPFMLPVSSKGKDLGTIVEGKIESGSVKKNAQLLMMPAKTTVEVSAIYNENEQEIPGAIVGEQVKLKLKGMEDDEIAVGSVLTSASNPVRAVTRFEAQVAIVEIKSILTAGYNCVMHVHTAIEEVTFTKLLHKLEKGTNRKSKRPPAFAKKGMKIIAELEVANPVCIETFANLPQLGRFTLRDQGVTIAIGKVTKLLE